MPPDEDDIFAEGISQRGRGRPRKEIDLAQVEKLALIHCTDAEMASICGVSVDTWTRRKQEDPEFVALIERGRSEGNASLRRLQFKRAMTGSDALLIWLGKQRLGQKDRQEVSGEGGGPVVQHIVTGVPRDRAD